MKQAVIGDRNENQKRMKNGIKNYFNRKREREKGERQRESVKEANQPKMGISEPNSNFKTKNNRSNSKTNGK